jgi:hypothetical protein
VPKSIPRKRIDFLGMTLCVINDTHIEQGIKARINPPVGPNIAPSPEPKPENTGIPMIPINTYT